MVGLKDPETKGVTVRGMRPTAIERSNVQWYEPWDGDGLGTGAGSFAVSAISLWLTSSRADQHTSSVNSF